MTLRDKVNWFFLWLENESEDQITRLPQARKWLGKKFFKVREKSGYSILSQGKLTLKKSQGQLKLFNMADLTPWKVGGYIWGHCGVIDILPNEGEDLLKT